MGRTKRPGVLRAALDYDKGYWIERGIRASRFLPCPHCGGAVLAKERTLLQSPIGPAVFRRAECSNLACRWSYSKEGGTREEFVRDVNTREGDRHD